MQRKILLLEDDLQLSDTVKQYLEYQGYEVVTAYDAHEARDRLYETHIDLMLLDIKVPYQNGFDLLAALREEGDTTPAIFITSLHSIENVTRGFDVGGDDYVRKPFALKELLVRIESLLRRQYGSREDIVDLGDGLQFAPKEFQLTRNGTLLPMKTRKPGCSACCWSTPMSWSIMKRYIAHSGSMMKSRVPVHSGPISRRCVPISEKPISKPSKI